MITHLNTVTVYVSDQDRSVDFYVGVLGFEKRADRDMGPAGRWIEVCPPGAATGLVLARGADVTEPHVQAWGTSFQVTDPDGLAVLIKQTR